MKKTEKHELQKGIASKNERKILRILTMGRMRFTDLRRTSGMSDPGLLLVLKRLQKQGKVERKKKGKQAFYVTQVEGNVKEIKYLGDSIERLRENGAKYYLDFSDNLESDALKYDLPFGMWSHLFVDKDIGKAYNPFTKRDIFELEKSVFDRIKENIGDNPLRINHKLKGKDTKIILGFEINYDDLIESLEKYKGSKEDKMVNARRRELMR